MTCHKKLFLTSSLAAMHSPGAAGNTVAAITLSILQPYALQQRRHYSFLHRLWKIPLLKTFV